MTATTLRPLLLRIMEKVEVGEPGECWNWTAATTSGYGMVGLGTREDGSRNSHRVLYELMFGPLPDGWQVDHLCRNTACLNPAHLEAVPQLVNLQRQAADALAERTTCNRGHDRATHGRVVCDSKGRFKQYRCRECARLTRRERVAL